MRASLLALAVGLAVPTAALGATLNVNSTADSLVAGDSECTLREAIINANGDSHTTAGITPLGSPDPSCGSALGNSEAPQPAPGCGLGPELAPALLLLGIARRRTRSPR